MERFPLRINLFQGRSSWTFLQTASSKLTMKMEILLEPTSNKLMIEHVEFDESNANVLERFYTSAGNPVKEILLKLNLPDHRIRKDGGEVKESQRSFRHSDTERLSRSDEVLKLKNFKKDATLKLFKCGDPNHLIRDCLKPPKDKNQRAFVRGSWSDSGEEDDEKAKDEMCLMDQASSEICLGVNLEPDKWIKDNGCYKHMTGNRNLFSSYKAYNGGNVIFGSNLCGNIIGKGTISHGSLNIANVEHVDNLGFNLLSVGQICDRKKSEDKICLATIDENSTLWHRRLGHANMRLIQSLASKELVRNLPKLRFDQHFCDACKIRKQAHASHKAKNIVSTTRCLELLHMDLFGSSAVRSYGGNLYTLVIVDDYSRYTWTRFLNTKTEAFEQFEIFSKKIQNQLGCSIVSIGTDHGREFDNEVQFREFCNANESLNVTFGETPPPSKTSPLVDDELDEAQAIKIAENKNIENDIEKKS
ncbi:retrovirus-related pol polyprotein from transposon TNT 1-94 [Tanacetum coccineum]